MHACLPYTKSSIPFSYTTPPTTLGLRTGSRAGQRHNLWPVVIGWAVAAPTMIRRRSREFYPMTAYPADRFGGSRRWWASFCPTGCRTARAGCSASFGFYHDSSRRIAHQRRAALPMRSCSLRHSYQAPPWPLGWNGQLYRLCSRRHVPGCA